MTDLERYKKKQLEDPAFREEYERTREDFSITKALIAARLAAGMTQKELAEKSGVRQSNISRIESGTCSPSITTLRALAAGLGKTMVVRFE